MVLPGSITQRRTRCGRDGCACRADPPRPHGPYWQWTRKVAAFAMRFHWHPPTALKPSHA